MHSNLNPPGQQRPSSADRFTPFPIEVLPEPIRGFVKAGAKAIGCDLSYLALPVLIAVAAAIGNTRRLRMKRGWDVPPILWGATVGDSGTAKSPPFKLAMKPIRDRQGAALERYEDAMRQYEIELANYECELAEWKRAKLRESDPPAKPAEPVAQRCIVSDTTIEALAPLLLANSRGLLMARDELSGWFGSFDRYSGKGGGDAANWLSMFGAENITVDRKTGSHRTIFVPHAAIWICGSIQPGILQRALGREHCESGLAARILLAYPPRKAKKWTESDISPDAEAEFAALIERLYELNPELDPKSPAADPKYRPIIVRLTHEAKEVWVPYYDAHATEQVGLQGDLAAAWSKLEEYPARLALVVHLIRWAAEDETLQSEFGLDADSMQAGIQLATWFKGEAQRVYAMLSESDDDRLQRRLVEWIERKGGSTTAREVQQGCRWLKSPGLAEAELQSLVKADLGNWEPKTSASNGGRSTRVFRLSRVSTSTEPKKTSYEPPVV